MKAVLENPGQLEQVLKVVRELAGLVELALQQARQLAGVGGALQRYTACGSGSQGVGVLGIGDGQVVGRF